MQANCRRTNETVFSISTGSLNTFASLAGIVATACLAILEAGETLVSIYSIRRLALTIFGISIKLETIYTLTSV